ncbi:MAG: phospholipase D-like domain-containing protein [Myxococcota bacterium]
MERKVMDFPASSVAEGNVQVQVVTNHGELQRLFGELTAWAEELHLAYAWAGPTRGKHAHWKALPLEKVTRAIIGTHFMQTHPEALRRLGKRRGVLRVVADREGVFHPKVILGRRGDEARAILGSSNFTDGGFQHNEELNVLVAGPAGGPPLSEIAGLFDRWWRDPRAFAPTQAWLRDYGRAHAKAPEVPEVPSPPTSTQLIVRSIEDLDVDWETYFQKLVAQERRSLADGRPITVFRRSGGQSYLSEIARCRQAFGAHERFADMPESDRMQVCGWGPDTSGHLGRMEGAPSFKEAVRQRSSQIGRALDLLPLRGSVTVNCIRECAEELWRIHGVGRGAATRLLAVKRPDLCFPVNNANEEKLQEIFGVAPSRPSKYVELLQRVWELPWFSYARPAAADEQEAYDARVALLDAMLYELPAQQRARLSGASR